MNGLHEVYLGLGANLGDRHENLLQALQEIRAWSTIEVGSSYYETKPVGYLEQPDFLNIVCRIKNDLGLKMNSWELLVLQGLLME